MADAKQDLNKGLWFDDLSEGDVFESRSATVTESQMVEFAMLYDPQPIHIDAASSGKGMHGGLIASGILTFGFANRLWIDTGILGTANLGGVGLDELRWLKPVLAGDTLRAKITVVSIHPSSSKPDRGVIVFLHETFNQDGVMVMTYNASIMLRRRPED